MATANSSRSVRDPRVEALGPEYRRARLRWPGFEVTYDDFVNYVTERQRASPTPISEHATDLYLACACLRGVPLALRALEREYLEPALIHATTETSRDDLRQAVLEKLLLRRDRGRRRLEDYSGRSSLRTWIRVVAKRTQLNLVRGLANCQAGSVEELPESKLIPTGSDPELDYLRCRYTQEFQQAFRAALCSLDARSTLLLKLHLVERTTGSEMAALFGVSRVTVVRWMADIRQHLLSVTRRSLQRARRLSRTEFDSVVRLVCKHLNLSLSMLEQESS